MFTLAGRWRQTIATSPPRFLIGVAWEAESDGAESDETPPAVLPRQTPLSSTAIPSPSGLCRAPA